MRVPSAAAAHGGAHLTYCTNIHPAETWAEVRANLERYVLAVRTRVAPTQRFGIGLRLSALAAEQLESDLRRVVGDRAIQVGDGQVDRAEAQSRRDLARRSRRGRLELLGVGRGLTCAEPGLVVAHR